MQLPYPLFVRAGLFLLCVLVCACTSGEKKPDPSEETPMEAYRFFVGTASGEITEGIYTVRFHPADGSFTREQKYGGILNPGFLDLAPDGQTLYAIHAIPDQREGGVSAFAVQPDSGALTLLNQRSSMGRGPCYVSVSPSGRWAYVANYGSGSVSAYPILADGRLDSASSVIQHQGSSIHPQRQEGPHAHYIREGTGGYLYAADLGTDQVLLYQMDASTGTLQAAEPPYFSLDPGMGPRHIDYHPNGRFVYVMNELAGSVSVFEYLPEEKTFSALQTLSSLPAGFEGENKSADIHVHPNGRFLYASNRGEANGIAIFLIDETTGMLTYQGAQQEGIVWPRNFAIDPSGQYLLVANRDEDNILSFRIDPETGMLSPTGFQILVPQPICIEFDGRVL